MELETKRLLLRPLQDHDGVRMAQILNNLEISKHLARIAHPYGLADAMQFIALQRSFNQRSHVSAITFKCAPDELLGVIAYEYSAETNQTEFGYWLSQCCWGQRIMTEAAKALLDYGFNTGEFAELHANYWNPISGHLLRNLGFKETHTTMTYCLALNRKVAATHMHLTRESKVLQ